MPAGAYPANRPFRQVRIGRGALALGRPGRAVWHDLLQGTMLQTQTSDETDGRGSREPKLRPRPTGSPPHPFPTQGARLEHSTSDYPMPSSDGYNGHGYICAHFWARASCAPARLAGKELYSIVDGLFGRYMCQRPNCPFFWRKVTRKGPRYFNSLGRRLEPVVPRGSLRKRNARDMQAFVPASHGNCLLVEGPGAPNTKEREKRPGLS